MLNINPNTDKILSSSLWSVSIIFESSGGLLASSTPHTHTLTQHLFRSVWGSLWGRRVIECQRAVRPSRTRCYQGKLARRSGMTDCVVQLRRLINREQCGAGNTAAPRIWSLFVIFLLFLMVITFTPWFPEKPRLSQGVSHSWNCCFYTGT